MHKKKLITQKILLLVKYIKNPLKTFLISKYMFIKNTIFSLLTY